MTPMVKPKNLAEEVMVRDVMSSPVIESKEEETAEEIAGKMAKYHVGSVVVVSDSKPVGVITKRDLIDKVVAKNLTPSGVTAKEIMTSPVHETAPDEKIQDAARKMNKLKVSRLVVAYKGRVSGLVSMKDVMKVTPEIFDIMQETMRVREPSAESAQPKRPVEGICDSCGEWSDLLLPSDGQLLCEECRLDMEEASRPRDISE